METFCEFAVAVAAYSSFADGNHINCGELCTAVIFATSDLFRMFVQTVSVASSYSALGDSVSNVVCLCPVKKVVRIATRWIVAGVAGVCVKAPLRQLECNA